MIEMIDEIHAIDIDKEVDGKPKHMRIFCNRLERFHYGIIGRKSVHGLFLPHWEDVFVIHTNLDKDGSAQKADFKSIKTVLDEMDIKIIG